MRRIFLFVSGVAALGAQDLAYPRHFCSVSALVLNSTEKKVDASASGSEKGTVLVIFRTSERGTVTSARALSGAAALQKAAISAINQWKFKPSSLSGQPVQICSAVSFDFSHNPAITGVPKPMTAAALSPGFQFRCSNGLENPDANTVNACELQLIAIEHDSQASSMDRFTAYDEYGLALLKYTRDTGKALAQFNQAIAAKPEGLSDSDAEWGYVHWHRAVAQQKLGNAPEAEKDFAQAEDSLEAAQKAIANEKIAAYYRLQLGNIAKQHAELLEAEKKHSEAVALLKRFAK